MSNYIHFVRYVQAIVIAVAGAAAAVADGDWPAAPAGEAPPLDELAAEVLRATPALEAARARLDAARELVGPAGALPQPRLDLTLQDVGFPRITVGNEEMSMFGGEVRQALPARGKRDARRSTAAAEAGVRKGESEALRRSILTELRLAYARIYALDQERGSLDAAREMLEMLSETVAARYGSGEGELEAFLKTRLALARLGERAEDVAAERASAVETVQRLRASPGPGNLGAVRSLAVAPLPPRPWEELVKDGAPLVALKRAAVAAAERRLAQTRLERRPDLEAMGGLAYRGSYDPVATFGFGIELPVGRSHRQEPMIRAAVLELAAAQADLCDAEASVLARTARLGAELDRSEAQIRRYREAIVPQTSAAIDAARSAYLAGRGDFSTVIEDFQLWLEARTGLARREAERFSTWAEIDALIPPTRTAQGDEP